MSIEEGAVSQVGEEQVAAVVNQEQVAPVVQEQSVYAVLAQKVGWEANDEDSFVGNVSKLQSEFEQARKEREELASSMKRISPFLMSINEELSSTGFEGTDQELAQRLQEKIALSQRNYAELATKSPLDVIAEGLLLDAANYSKEEAADLAESIVYDITQRVANMNPDLEDDALDAKVNRLLAAEAKKYVPALEEKRPKLGLRPEGVKTPEQREAEFKAEQDAATQRLHDAVLNFKQIEVGDTKWDFSLLGDGGKIRQEVLPMVEVAADPAKFFNTQFCDSQGNYDPGKALRMMAAFDQFSHILAAKEAEARGGGAKTVERQMMNVNGGGNNQQNPQGGGGGQAQTMSQVAQDFFQSR